MNTRLQVEHPVTECVTGLDLVRLQLPVAEGQPLPVAAAAADHRARHRGPAVRRGSGADDWLPVNRASCIAFTVDGQIQFAPAPGLRLDSGVGSGSVVGVHYDPMLAKVIAWAPTRPRRPGCWRPRCARARLHGVATNRDLLVRVLDSDEFRPAAPTPPSWTGTPRCSRRFCPMWRTPAVALAAALAAAAAAPARCRVAVRCRRAGATCSSAPQRVRLRGAVGSCEVDYRLDRAGALVDPRQVRR